MAERFESQSQSRHGVDDSGAGDSCWDVEVGGTCKGVGIELWTPIAGQA